MFITLSALHASNADTGRMVMVMVMVMEKPHIGHIWKSNLTIIEFCINIDDNDPNDDNHQILCWRPILLAGQQDLVWLRL